MLLGLSEESNGLISLEICNDPVNIDSAILVTPGVAFHCTDSGSHHVVIVVELYIDLFDPVSRLVEHIDNIVSKLQNSLCKKSSATANFKSSVSTVVR